MALELTARAKLLSQRRNVEPNLILEIDGVPTLYATISTLKIAKFGDSGLYFGKPGLIWGGGVEDDNVKSLISTQGSGSTITQQLLQDKGSASSVSSLNLELIDKDGEISRLISPGVIVDELLTRRCVIYLNFKDGFHPQDSVAIHRGIIDDISPQAGSVKINIAAPEQLKRQELFIKQENQLNGSINNSATTITVDSTDGFITPSAEMHSSYIQINDEIIKWTAKTATQFTGCTRGQLGTTATSHNDDDTVNSFYRLEGNAIDMALKLMLSGGTEYFAEDLETRHLGGKSVSEQDPTIIFFDLFDVKERYGLTSGDLLSITGASNVGNNLVDAVITDFGKTDSGSWIEVDASLIWEPDTAGVVSLKSKYNVLTHGMQMSPEDVDVARHEDLKTRFNSSIPSYDFYIKDTVNGKDFLSQEIYYPAGLYALPRKTRASVGITVPPIADSDVPFIDSNNISKPSKLLSQRSINKNFYNAVVVKYNEQVLEEKFINGKVTFSGSAVTRFKNIGNKPLTVISKGLRPSAATETLIRVNSRRWLERYESAAELIPKVTVLFKEGFKIDVGDTVVFGDENLKMVDLGEGSRQLQPKLYEVVNKSLSLKTGEVTLDLLATNFAIDGRYSIVSPSSLVSTGSTTTKVYIKDSFSTLFPKIEKDKWVNHIGMTILIHSPDWTYAHETTLVSFDPSDEYAINVDPALPSAPLNNYIIDVPVYPTSTNASINSTYKLLYAFFDPQVEIVSGSSNTVFTVGAGDIGKFFVGSVVRVHSDDYLTDAEETTVIDITGNTITVDDDLGFTPVAGQKIDLIGFPDLGLAYRLI